MCSSSPVRTPKLQLAAEQPLKRKCWIPPKKDAPHPRAKEKPQQDGSVQFSSVTKSCPTLCDPMNRSTLGLPVQYQLSKFTQTHVHRFGDAIQPSHPLLSPSSPAPIPPSFRVFSKESTLNRRWPKYWSFSFSISPSKNTQG